MVNIGNEWHFIQEIEYGDFNYAIDKKSTTRLLTNPLPNLALSSRSTLDVTLHRS